MTPEERQNKARTEIQAILDRYGCFLDAGVINYKSGRIQITAVEIVALDNWQSIESGSPDASDAE